MTCFLPVDVNNHIEQYWRLFWRGYHLVEQGQQENHSQMYGGDEADS